MAISGYVNNRAGVSGGVNSAGGVSGGVTNGISGTRDYNELENKPSINNIEVSGDKTAHDYGIANLTDIPTPSVYNLIKTKLWDYVTDNNNNIAYNTGTYTLNDNINNYDMIVLELASYWGDIESGSAWNGSAFITLFPYLLNSGYYPNRINICTFASRSTNLEIKDNYIIKRIDNEGGTNGLIRVWGVKLGAVV